MQKQPQTPAFNSLMREINRAAISINFTTTLTLSFKLFKNNNNNKKTINFTTALTLSFNKLLKKKNKSMENY